MHPSTHDLVLTFCCVMNLAWPSIASFSSIVNLHYLEIFSFLPLSTGSSQTAIAIAFFVVILVVIAIAYDDFQTSLSSPNLSL